MNIHQSILVVVACILLAVTSSETVKAQSTVALIKRSENRPLQSLRRAGEAALRNPAQPRGFPFIIPNKIPKEDLRTQTSDIKAPDLLNQETQGSATTNVLSGFLGADNDDNANAFGFRVAPPDTDGDVGPNRVVQMINLLTTVFDKSGNVVPGGGPFPSNAYWAGVGGLCEPFNQGDPVVVYDEAADRWFVSQFAFNDAFTQFAHCVAVSTSGDPVGSYNRYEFGFNDIGFPDYPKHGIVSESITMMANIFQPRGPFFHFAGTFVGVMDKAAMYAGSSGTLVGFNLGSSQFGFVAADLDDPAGSASFVPALFATAMTNANQFDVWRVSVDWNNPGGASATQVAAVPITPFDPDLCSASREECAPQPGTTQRLEVISDRLMQRLQIRDFGTHQSMVAAHTVDVGSGRAGIRWYELRDGGSGWSLYQEGTYGPADGKHRWMPSIAMNAAGDIGLGYLMSDGVATYMSTALTGQTAVNTGSGILDGAEISCMPGGGAQTGTGRSGDYSATVVDPVTDTFWHTNEFVPTTSSFGWATAVCEFDVTGGSTPTPTVPDAPTALSATAVSSSQIDLSWTNNATNADEVQIERSPDGSNFSYLTSVGPTLSSYSDTGLPASTTKYYRVRASNEVGPSGYSNIASDVTLGDGPASSVHVEDITTGTENKGQGRKLGFAVVSVRDDLNQPVEGALVTGTFSGTFNEAGRSGTTGVDGTAKITSSTTARGGVSVSFCVNSVSTTLPYDPADNGNSSFDCGGGVGKADLAATSSETFEGFELAQNFPNPFNPVTAIGFTLPESHHVVVKVFNILGEEVATLVDGVREKGSHNVRFDASHLSTGLYIYTIQAGAFVSTRRMSLLK